MASVRICLMVSFGLASLMAPRFTDIVNGRLIEGGDDVGFVNDDMISYEKCDASYPTCFRFEVTRLPSGEISVIDETPLNDFVNSFALAGSAVKQP